MDIAPLSIKDIDTLIIGEELTIIDSNNPYNFPEGMKLTVLSPCENRDGYVYAKMSYLDLIFGHERTVLIRATMSKLARFKGEGENFLNSLYAERS